jgi:hypothetical protein
MDNYYWLSQRFSHEAIDKAMAELKIDRAELASYYETYNMVNVIEACGRIEKESQIHISENRELHNKLAKEMKKFQEYINIEVPLFHLKDQLKNPDLKKFVIIVNASWDPGWDEYEYEFNLKYRHKGKDTPVSVILGNLLSKNVFWDDLMNDAGVSSFPQVDKALKPYNKKVKDFTKKVNKLSDKYGYNVWNEIEGRLG